MGKETMKEEKKLDYLCTVCEKSTVKTDGYYHSYIFDVQPKLCLTCYEAGVLWAAKQAYKGKN